METPQFENIFLGQDWETLMQQYLDKFGDTDRTEAEISSLFFKLTKNSEKKSSFFWHIRSFQEYMKSNINPLGLRIQIFPTLEDLDATFRSTWENTLQTCSRNLMQILIDEYTKRSLVLDTEITKICERLKTFQVYPSVSTKENKLKIHLESFNKNILIKKNSKFHRDKNAFEAGKAYKWNQNNRTTRNYYTSQNPPSNKSSLHIPPLIISKAKPSVGTKRQLSGDPTLDQKPKKSSTEKKSNPLSTAHSDNTMKEPLSNHSAQAHPLPPSRNTSNVHEPNRNDSSFLDLVLAGLKPPPPNLNTYTQLTL